MVSREYIESIIKKYKKSANKCIKKEKYELALEMISNAAKLIGSSNIEYKDENLEGMIENISLKLDLNTMNKKFISNTIIFYDGFGENTRGLAEIYLMSLVKIKSIVYVTYKDRKDKIPGLINLLNKNNSKIEYINRSKSNYLEQIYQLNSIINKYNPSDFIFYSFPSDVVATTVLYSYEKVFTRYQINLTDHAFWLGANCIDYCIEFRNYGAYISNKYRGIPESKIVKLPYYPMIHSEKDFEGFPFMVEKNKKIVFSGGSLYKTIGDNNKYYKMVKKLLEQNENMIFWYAGRGDATELNKVIKKFPNRVFHTNERNDLFQVLKKSCFYLSTYPICGGLMFQFAAKAGCVPITLKYDDCSDEFLINQNNANIEFKNEKLLYEECKKLLCDDKYREKRSIEIEKTVISENDFYINLKNIINCKSSKYEVQYVPVNTDNFKLEYLKRLKKTDVNITLANKSNLKGALYVTPLRFVLGVFLKLIRKFNGKR